MQADEDVLGLLYWGSLGRGVADRYSDLDIEIWVRDEVFEDPAEKLEQILGRLGKIRFSYRRGPGFSTGFVGDAWTKVDLVLKRRADLTPGPLYAEVRVVKDTGGVLARLVAESAPERVTATPEETRTAVEEAIDSQIYIALQNARGAVWSAYGDTGYRATVLYEILAKLRGRRSYGLRYVEELLSPAEQELLSAALPSAATGDEVRKAARALWIWTRHVRDQAERALAGPLAVAVDEAELLSAVDRIYSRE